MNRIEIPSHDLRISISTHDLGFFPASFREYKTINIMDYMILIFATL